MNLALIVNSAIAPVAFLLFCLPALRNPEARRWIPVVILMSVLDSVATLLPVYVHTLQFPNVHWNWGGKVLDIAVMLVVAMIFIMATRFTARDFGLTFRQAPGTWRAIVFMMVPYLIIIAVLTAKYFGETQPQTAETIWYEATMPGLAEELLWRGILLAILDRMFTARLRLANAEIGYGAIALTLVFALVHGIHFDKTLTVQTDWMNALMAGVTGFALVWLRLRTKSLVLPVVLHNATNVILETVPLMH
ncbi:MAG TPA: CPBP family intramembrane glutamic endopeptidase [Rhizomicrobium sp.]|nr:CPBP family intramembrane glutamic endopeptidase [Rhizomicrobium sp.]